MQPLERLRYDAALLRQREAESRLAAFFPELNVAVVSVMGLSPDPTETEVRDVFEGFLQKPLPSDVVIRTHAAGQRSFGRAYVDMRTVKLAVELTTEVMNTPHEARRQEHGGVIDVRIGTKDQHKHFLKREQDREMALQRDRLYAQRAPFGWADRAL